MPSLLHRQAEAGGYRWPGRALRAPLRPAGQEVEASRFDQLRIVKLRTLVADHLVREAAHALVASALPGGAALYSPESRAAYVLIDDGAVAGFGAALAWADRRQAISLDVLVAAPPGATEPGIIARRAAEFALAVRVWSVEGRSLTAASPAPVLPPEEAPAPDLVDLLAAAGLEVVAEHGVLRGEVLGLEVARTVAGRLEVGVGRHDRMARAEMRPGEPPASALAEAAAAVRALRVAGAPSHPANRLARSRWLRAVACAGPTEYGFSSLYAVAPPLPWFDLPEAAAAPAVGTSASGDPVLAVFSVGVDLDLVATAADARVIHSPGAALVLVVPEGDDLPVTRSLAARLERPAAVQVVPRDWDH